MGTLHAYEVTLPLVGAINVRIEAASSPEDAIEQALERPVCWESISELEVVTEAVTGNCYNGPLMSADWFLLDEDAEEEAKDDN